MRLIDNLSSCLPANTATIGCFDGVHLGHRHLIDQVCSEAAQRGQESLLITFSNHPRAVLQNGYIPQLLSTTDEKLSLLAGTGADMCVPLLFTKEMSQMTAFTFMKSWLHERFNVQTLIIGYNHSFGKPAGETFDDYRAYGKTLGMEVVVAEEYLSEGEHVSSSVIRQCLSEGNIRKASRLLGRHYTLTGHIVAGHQVGRTLGFPTANISLSDPQKIIPKSGSYAVRASLCGQTFAGMLYIGNRPTFGNNLEQAIELNLLHFNGDIYGQDIRVEFVERLRGEQRFSSPEELRRQLLQDRQHTEEIISTNI